MRVVIIDDVLPNAMLFKISVMKVKGVEPVVFSKPFEALEWCRRNQADMVLVDYDMPELKGCDVVTQLREMPHMADVPIMMIVAQADSMTMISALKAGADDFLTKPVEDILLQARTRSMLRLRSVKRDLIATKKKLTAVTGIDALTGVRTREVILDSFDAARHAAILNGTDLAVFWVDVDSLKQTNATYGLAVGDRVLKTVAKMLHEIAGAKAEYGRVGSDEFLVIAPLMNADTALKAAQRMQKTAEPLTVEGLASASELTVSVTMAIINQNRNCSMDQVLCELQMGIKACREAGGSHVQLV